MKKILFSFLWFSMFANAEPFTPVAGNPYLDGQSAPVITCITNNGVVFVFQGYNCPQGSVKK